MGKNISLKKGYNIKIVGGVTDNSISNHISTTYAIKPTDFYGIAPIPKLVPEIGSEIKAGEPLLYDKKNADLVFTAPVSGEVVELRRGSKRKVTEVVILADKEQRFKDFGKTDLASATAEDVKTKLIESGAWHFLRQRPFLVSAKPTDTPKGIFISGFNTSPLSPNAETVMQGKELEFQAGIDALAKIAPVHLTVQKGSSVTAFEQVNNATTHTISGQHPAGNVGVQIHHISPIRKGEVAWIVNMQDVAVIGKLMMEGIYHPERVISVAGNALETPGLYRVIQGVNLEELVSTTEDARVIDGDVLTGTPVAKESFLGFYSNQISVIKEGDEYEMFGWLLPSYPRPTKSRSLFGSFLSSKPFDVNTNTHGERRAFVVSGQYEDVLPMNIYPVQLLKAILANDFEGMEGLGIYEVVEEDFALCEFVCTSKQPVQQILRDGLEYVREQS